MCPLYGLRVSATFAGPGAYNIAGMGSESMRKAYIESTRRGVFGTTAVRINPMTKKGEHDQPGPSHYQVRERGHEPRYQQLTSNFSSLTQRLPDTVPAVLKVRVRPSVPQRVRASLDVMAFVGEISSGAQPYVVNVVKRACSPFY